MNLRHYIAIGLLAAAPLANLWAAGMSAPTTVTGEVLEVKDVALYTYVRLKTPSGETWAAVGKAPIQKGATITLKNVSVMENFESTSLKKTFPSILFGDLASGPSATSPHAGLSTPPAPAAPIKVAKASGPNAFTVADLISKAGQLKDKPVRVSGQVVKYNAGIMGKNWLHLRDGSGTQANATHDILVTTTAPAKLGDIVTVAGVVHTDKDFGAGYTYKVLIEDATLQPR